MCSRQRGESRGKSDARPVLSRRFRADLRAIGLFEDIEPDSWELGPAHVEGLDLQPDTHGR